MKTKLSKKTIQQIVEKSTNVVDCLILLYSEVIKPTTFEEVEQFNDFPKTNRETSQFILKQMGEKYEILDIFMLWLNKGFGEDETLKDFEVKLSKNCYQLK